jgi:high-affinity nickel-transport protein
VARLRAALTPAERRRAALLAAVVVGLHLVGLSLLLAGGAVGIGVGVTAYALGLRHAVDADHIAAIDNTTRKLVGEGQRPLGIGLFFSLGHSTVVLALSVLVGLGVRGLRDGAVHRVGATIGSTVSGSFLFLIGALNLVVLVGLVRAWRRGGDGTSAAGGLLTRLYGRATRAIHAPWQMYPLGCLFGLGFDTATEVALLVLAGGAVAGGVPVSAVLCLPILFAAGMTLLDTADGVLMRFAYGWAMTDPSRKALYNVTLTGLSVAVALGIGGVQLLSTFHVVAGFAF